MDLDAVADELYGLAPGDFTAARDERVKAARAAGDRDLAEQIRRLRRPTLAAWASNLLVREQPDETERLLQLGEALRQAHQDLDGAQLRELSAQQHQLTFALARQAGQLTAQAGQRISDDVRQEVQDTLHAALADPEAAEQVAEGRLAKPLSAPAGFPTSVPQPPQAPVPRRATRPADEVADLDAARTRRREQQERLERARQQASDAQRELHERESELVAAEEEQRRAEEEQQQAEQRVNELSRQLQDAERDQQRAREATRKTRDRTRETRRTVREVQRRAKDTATHARKIAE
ncbi:IgA-specific serine endopeptidase autotransporter [Streptomyces sp. MBT84]|uniref:hypothetical protein n=1 Tax=Streptomyces sp. MBT84 TaxID=1488414 RepID=UPI001C6DEED0|nr:hypothetical protein [Streptomyces sp. MBT84]MBW8707501.1 IgA-specific serine endopeptidase autotransporter [Streptomyces sp. MBT84]